MDDLIRKKLLELGWKPSTRYPNTDHWHFFEVRNFNVLRVACLIEDGDRSAEEVQQVKTYLRQRMPWFTLKDMGLVIVFPRTSRFVDLSNDLSKYAEKTTVQKIIQITPEKVYEQKTWATGIIDHYLGNLISEIAGTREVVTSKIDGGILENAWKKNWLWYVTLLIAFLGILSFLLK